MNALLNVALDGTIADIKKYLNTNLEAKAILGLSYDGNYMPDYFVVTDEVETAQIKRYIENHRNAYNGYRWYAIYTIENGELKQFHGFDAEAWCNKYN